MRVDRRLTVLGVMLVILSMVMATQYATTRIGYSYSIVHPSDADIRFVGCDNSSEDGLRLLRIDGTNGTDARLKVEFGDVAANWNKSYTAAFAIVIEEQFAVNLTHLVVNNGTYMQIYIHGNGSLLQENDPTSVCLWNNGSNQGRTPNSSAWQFARGDGDPSTMLSNISDTGTTIRNYWDQTEYVKYVSPTNLSGDEDDALPIGGSYGDVPDDGRSRDNASDFAWIQISLDIPSGAPSGGDWSGTIEFHFKADTYYGED